MAGWRPALPAAAVALLLAGCTSGPDDESDARGEPGGTSAASPSTSPPSSPTPESEPYTLAEDRAPKTRADAVTFVRDLDVRPDYFGSGFRGREPRESDPARWAVLGQDCLWRREALPATVLASLTRAFELPERDGKGPVYVSVTVTVHRDAVSARRDMAGALESAMRCPEQRLNATDRVRGLYSQIDAFADGRSALSEDDLTETGEWLGGDGKAHPFDWYKYRVGPVTVAATARHGAGRSAEEDDAITGDMGKGVGFVAAEVHRQGESGESGESGEPGGAGGPEATGGPAESEGADR
ncbi:hypothetical protein [Streptomyces griseiscabiei]|uniref:Lipoprotein n=1 Tax=Streptomyces griseiscabiei TaxID=2993540 RepID=A0ABU4L1G3_9ACTN|nr:hypothetical protein [Streptomyces griseiscabiei]MBZ3905824.1 hypothetical protein [Streptomyces griseiscabiei]MDX2909453.1 hypothetical protein [Streptomyces griseiscabiei]